MKAAAPKAEILGIGGTTMTTLWNLNAAVLLVAMAGIGACARGSVAAPTCSALTWRAYAKEDLGDLSGALTDLLQAHGPSDAGSYTRYTLALTIGGLFAATGEPRDSIAWYRGALETVVVAKDLSGGSARRSFLELKGEEGLAPKDRALRCDRKCQPTG
jgi:hypothetical protein